MIRLGASIIRTLSFMLALATGALAQTALSPPQIGYVQDGARAVHPVYGIAGNFMVGSAVPGAVVSFASSGSFQLVKTDSAVITLGRLGQVAASMSAPPGPALFAFAQDGTPALAYLPAANELFEWSGGAFQAVTFDPGSLEEGEVVSIAAPDPTHAAFIVQRGDILWDVRVLVATGGVDSQSALAGVNAPALMLASGDIVYAAVPGRGRSLTRPNIVIRGADGSEVELPADLPAGFSLAQMGNGWVELRGIGVGSQFAIRTTAGHAGVYRLPVGVE
jgi:hypothetical protein